MNRIAMVIGSWGSYNECNERALGSEWLDFDDYDDWEEVEKELKNEGFELDGTAKRTLHTTSRARSELPNYTILLSSLSCSPLWCATLRPIPFVSRSNTVFLSNPILLDLTSFLFRLSSSLSGGK